MKKMHTYTKTMLVALMALMAFTSCDWVGDEDAYIAYDITGRWVGQLSEVYYNRFNWSVRDREYSTMFEFYQGDRYSGRGREVDYDHYGTVKSYNFRWFVEYGNIYLQYADGTELVIDGYYVRNNHLYGSTYDGSIQINLVRYDYYDDPWSYDSYYWSRLSKPHFDDEATTDSIQ